MGGPKQMHVLYAKQQGP